MVQYIRIKPVHMHNSLGLILHQASQPTEDILSRINSLLAKVHLMNNSELITLYQALDILITMQPKTLFIFKNKMTKGAETLQQVIEQIMAKRVYEFSDSYSENVIASLSGNLTKLQQTIKGFEEVTGKKFSRS